MIVAVTLSRSREGVLLYPKNPRIPAAFTSRQGSPEVAPMEIKQQLRLSQQLVMTPQLQQAIRLLQLSRLELIDEIRKELDANPVLSDDEGERPAAPKDPDHGPVPLVENGALLSD